MNEAQNIQEAVDRFKNLAPEQLNELRAIDLKIQDFTGVWGTYHAGEQTKEGVLQLPWMEQNGNIQEFVQFMYRNDLVIPFDWSHWQEGRDWFTSQDQAKYSGLSVEIALKLLTASIREDRLNEGRLVSGFQDKSLPKIIHKLVELQP